MRDRPIETEIRAGRRPDSEEEEARSSEAFRATMARWASGVAVVAVREDDDAEADAADEGSSGPVHATTVSSFTSVSVRPPLVVVCLGAGAQVLPFLREGRLFVVNVLSAAQRRLATVFADSFPVGVSPFPETGAPRLREAHAHLVCSVEAIHEAGASRLVVGRVEEAAIGEGGEPLVRYGREYGTLTPLP